MISPRPTDTLRQAVRDAYTRSPQHLAILLESKYKPRDFERLLARHLAHWADTPSGRLSVAAPPRSGKSYNSVVWNSVWLACRNSDIEVAIACASQSLVSEHGSKIRSILKTHAPMLSVATTPGRDRADLVELTNGSIIRMVGIGAQLTGFGADYLIIDDAFRGWDDAHSPTVTKHRLDWVSAVALSRLYPDARALHVGTRWSDRDIHALADRLDWPLVRVPALCDSTNDPLGRALGEPLYTAHHRSKGHATRTWTHISDSLPEHIWQSLYMATPSQDQTTNLLPHDFAETLHPGNSIWTNVIAVDPSVTATDEGDTVGIVHAGRDTTGTIHITDTHTYRAPISDWITTVVRLTHRYRPHAILIEGNQGGAAWQALLADAARDIGVTLPDVVTLRAGRDKTTRAYRIASAIDIGTLTITTGADQGTSGIIRELSEWSPGNESPGTVDATALCLDYWHTEIIGHDWLPTPQQHEGDTWDY